LAHSLIQTLKDEDAGVEAVGALIARDPAIAAKLLQLANSAQFGLPRGVGSIEHAIAMVGMNKVRTLPLGACLCGSFAAVAGLDTQAFWKTSMDFPMQMVQALQRSADPLVDQAYSRLGAIVHLAGLLADSPDAGPAQLQDLPSDVLAALPIEADWMLTHFPNQGQRPKDST